jgi:hypothetical protein
MVKMHTTIDSGTSFFADENPDYLEAIAHLADAAIESFGPGPSEDLEAFESYTHALRCRIKETPDFRNRFISGYATILQEIKSKNK